MATWSPGVAIVGEAPNRKVVARRDLKRGETILQEKPTLVLLNPKQWSFRCNSCFSKPASNQKLLRCSRCRRFWYCSKKCQQQDWKLHKEECTALSRSSASHDESLLADALLLARMVRLGSTEPSKYQTVMNVVFHPECIQQSHYDIAKLVKSMNLLPSATAAIAIDEQQLVELLARFDSNNFGIVDELLFFLGAGIYPAGAMLNHSCDHNCAILYAPQTNLQVIKCIVNVQKGEELGHPYIDSASTSVTRRTKLKVTYGFDCHCRRCQDETGKWAQVDQWLEGTLSSTVDAEMAQSVIADTDQLLQQAAMTDAIEEELNLIVQAVQARAKVLHPRHLALYTARSQLHTTSMAAGDLLVASEQCTEIVETMETCFYRPEHPLIGIMQYTLGSLHHSLNCFQKAIYCYEKALPVLETYHGKDHSLATGCRDYLQQARQEVGGT